MMEIAIANLNKVTDQRESMIEFILSANRKRFTTDKQEDKFYFSLKAKSFKALKIQYDKLIVNPFSK